MEKKKLKAITQEEIEKVVKKLPTFLCAKKHEKDVSVKYPRSRKDICAVVMRETPDEYKHKGHYVDTLYLVYRDQSGKLHTQFLQDTAGSIGLTPIIVRGIHTTKKDIIIDIYRTSTSESGSAYGPFYSKEKIAKKELGIK